MNNIHALPRCAVADLLMIFWWSVKCSSMCYVIILVCIRDLRDVRETLASHAHSHARTSRSQSRSYACFAFFPTDFQGKERLLAVSLDKVLPHPPSRCQLTPYWPHYLPTTKSTGKRNSQGPSMGPVQVHKNLSLPEICKMAPRNVAAEISYLFLLSLQTDVWSTENRVQSRRGSRILKWGVNFCNNVIEPKPGWGKYTNGTNRRSRVWPVYFIYIIAILFWQSPVLHRTRHTWAPNQRQGA